MESTIFKKMKAKPGQTACVLFAPESYPAKESELIFTASEEQYDFVHLFVSSRQQFEERIQEAISKRKPGGLLWISYPKSAGKVKYDINRDILFDLSIPHGVHAVSLVALDDTWSALRVVENKPGETYERPNKG